MAHYPLYTQNLSLVGVCVKRIGKLGSSPPMATAPKYDPSRPHGCCSARRFDADQWNDQRFTPTLRRSCNRARLRLRAPQAVRLSIPDDSHGIPRGPGRSPVLLAKIPSKRKESVGPGPDPGVCDGCHDGKVAGLRVWRPIRYAPSFRTFISKTGSQP